MPTSALDSQLDIRCEQPECRPDIVVESPRTTKLYDRTGDEITLDEVERIAI
jgi:hypothetical protein